MNRRDFVSLLGGAAPAWPLAARGQSDRVRRIGLLMAATNEGPNQAQATAVRQGLESLGWVEGRNLRMEVRWGSGDPQQYQAMAAELIGLGPDVIVTQSNTLTTVVSRLTRTIPIVFAGASDPLETGLVTNMSRPGGNVTGFSQLEISIVGKYLELLKEAAPFLTRIAVTSTQEGFAAREYLKKIGTLAPTFGLSTTSIPVVDHPVELENGIDKFSREPDGGLVILSGPAASIHRKQIFAIAERRRLPAIYPYRFFSVDGGLMSYGPDLVDQYRRAASYVDRILKGEKPGDLPVQAPTKFELVINLKAAKTIGLEISPLLLARADEVIE
jgi:putative ABC transport system substrate-binding protein